MGLPLVFRRRVGEDLAIAYRWYEERRRGQGERLLIGVADVFDAIGRFPEMCPCVHGDVRRAVVIKFPYAIFFRVEPTRVLVLAVLHTSRDSRLWPKRH